VSTDTPQGDGRSEVGRVMNRRERRALAAQGLLPDINETLSEVWDLIFHIAISRNKGSEVILALSPRRWCDLQAAFAIEFANGLRIQDQLIALANHLQIPAALKFEFENNVLEVLGGTIMQVLRGHSSKEVAQVIENVIKDPSKATARVNESRLNDLVIRTLSEQVSIDASDPIAKLSGLEQLQRAARKAQAAFGESPPGRGRPREVHKSNFFEGVVAKRRPFAATSAYHNMVATKPPRRCFCSGRPCSTCWSVTASRSRSKVAWTPTGLRFSSD
jgi:hypothetical protein